jgi:RND family efflux transporter MFP subunit
MHETANPKPQLAESRLRLWSRRLLPLLVLVGAIVVGIVFIKTPPRAASRPQQRQATLVEVQPVAFMTQRAKIEAMGIVKPARRIELMPRVGGDIRWVSEDFVPGGLFETGATILQIDPVDYEIAKRGAEKSVTEARTNLRIEQGAQAVARQDYQLLGEVIGEEDRELVLRKPQLEMAEATVAAAEAELERAQIDLSRTTVKAPFNAIVEGDTVNVGARVTSTTSLATLIGTENYWVEATVPVGQLKWIEIPGPDSEEGSTVRIYDEAAWDEGQFRVGIVRRLAASLEEQGRMARVIIEVEDPLGLNDESKPRLLIGSFVRVEFEGRELEHALRIPRYMIHGKNEVWVFTPEGTLDIRQVEIALQARDYVVVTGGLNFGDRIITTELSAPVQDMALRIEDQEPGAVTEATPTR